MESRRHEDFASESSYSRSRRDTDMGLDGYGMMSPPRRMEVPGYSERVLVGRRSVSLERRRVVDDGGRRIRSRSPGYMDVKRGRVYSNEDWVGERDLLTPERRTRCELSDRVERKQRVDVGYSPTRNEFGYGSYGRESSRNVVIDDKFDGRRLDSEMNEMRTRKSTLMGMYRSTEDVGPTSRTERGADFSSGSLNVGLGQIGKERVQYPDVGRERVQYPDVGRKRVQYSDVGRERVQYPDVGKERVQYPDVGKERVQYPDVGKERVHYPDVGKERVEYPDVGRERVQYSDIGRERVQYPDVGKERVHYPDVGKERILYPDVEKERVQYPDPGEERMQYPDVRDSIPFDKYTATKQYGDLEKTMESPRDSFYNLSESRSRGSMDASHFKDYSRKSRDDLGYRGGIPLPRDENPLNSVHIPAPLSHSRYEQPHHLDINEDNVGRYRRETFTPPRTGNLDYSRLQPQTREREEYLYPSEELYEKMNMCERIDLDYRSRDILKPDVLDHVTPRAETSDFVRRNINNRSSLDHVSLEKLTGSNNFGLNRSPVEKREISQYLDGSSIYSRLGRKISREEEMAYRGRSQDREIERDYDFKREVGSRSYMESMRSPPRVLYDTERSYKMEKRDLSPYDSSSSRFLKRKYSMDEEENRITSRSMMSRLDTGSKRHNHDYIDDEWIDQDGRGSNLSSRRDHTHGFSRRADPVYDDELIIHDHEECMHDHPMKSYKYEDEYEKGYSRSGGRDEYKSYHPHRRNVLPRGKNVPIRREHGKEIDIYRDEQYEDWGSCVKSNEHEDSEKFKELVHEFFLSFTKKMNENPGVRRRYMEQGQAGSLFCIVCGRSLSKEFLDTQRLAMHAFMSHKSGLRVQHLGLVKAICVMLGWNSNIPAKTIRWFPEPLSTAQTWVQKEDLIIWPPVIIIHNTSISGNDSNGQGPTSLEALGQFLRGKGLSGGKVKPGKLANCSIMLVKFLGTFSGLQEAEKMHQYFAKNKHGRKDLDQITSSKGKSKSSNGEEKENKNDDKEAEKVVFGYMGIAEDLEKVDLDTKRKCVIKSKKEIQDLADGPVKPE